MENLQRRKPRYVVWEFTVDILPSLSILRRLRKSNTLMYTSMADQWAAFKIRKQIGSDRYKRSAYRK